MTPPPGRQVRQKDQSKLTAKARRVDERVEQQLGRPEALFNSPRPIPGEIEEWKRHAHNAHLPIETLI